MSTQERRSGGILERRQILSPMCLGKQGTASLPDITQNLPLLALSQPYLARLLPEGKELVAAPDWLLQFCCTLSLAATLGSAVHGAECRRFFGNTEFHGVKNAFV